MSNKTSEWISLGDDAEVGKISKFLSKLGRKTKRFFKNVKLDIEKAVITLSTKYINLGTKYFKKRAKHLNNLKDRRDYGRPMLRDFPKYIGVGIYEGFGALFKSIGSSLGLWKVDRQLAEEKKDNTN